MTAVKHYQPKIVISDDLSGLKELVTSEEPVIILKNFENESVCTAIRTAMVDFTVSREPRCADRFHETFFRVDINPPNSLCRRIFRTFFINQSVKNELWDACSKTFLRMNNIQRDYLGIGTDFFDLKAEMVFSPQIIHYPRGGGFFDWHEHPRFPTNYGLILSLSKKNKHFYIGQTEFEVPCGSTMERVGTGAYSDIGDLTLFKFDLLHRVSPVDKDSDIVFDENGRWTAVLPLLENSLTPV